MGQDMKGRRGGKDILVTGAAGFIGSHVCDALVGKGYKVVGLTRSSERRIEHLKNNEDFKAVKGNIGNFDQTFETLRKYEFGGIIHVAALHTPERIDSPFPYFEANTKGTLNLLEICRLLNIKKFIYSSTMSVYGRKIKYLPVDERHPTDPFDFYSLTKLQGEEFCRLYREKHKLNIVILRYAGVFGPRREWGALSNFVRKALRNEPPEVFGDISWDTIYVKDVAVANVSAFEKADELEFSIINIGRGEEVNIVDLANRILKISGSTAKPRISRGVSPFRFYYNIDKARKLLDFAPRPLDLELAEYIELEAGKDVRP